MGNFSQKLKYTLVFNRYKSDFVKLGSVRVQRKTPINGQLVPAYYGIEKTPSALLGEMKWLFQKDFLKQDVFLLGVPGKLRLEIVSRYLELLNRECEYLAITRDTTEADIKQRREIRGGTSFYTDLCAVRAALNGRVLVIDGVEKAERNVLPILNNLLENREMQLDDGRFLMKYDKYDFLKNKYDVPTLRSMGMERVSEDFHVVVLGLPVPQYPGHTLDPPFRSRFQGRNIQEESFQMVVEDAVRTAPNVEESEIMNLVSMVFAYNSEVSDKTSRIPISTLKQSFEIWKKNPILSSGLILDLVYPARLFLSENQEKYFENFRDKFDVKANNPKLPSVTTSSNGLWIPTKMQESFIEQMAAAFDTGDFFLTGSKGSGKSSIIHEFLRRKCSNYTTICLHRDMSSRDLLQRRNIDADGNTYWVDSELVRAAKAGNVCVLDGVDTVDQGMISSIAQLVYHRTIDIPDGSRLVSTEQFKSIQNKNGLTEADLNERKIYKIPPSFKLIFVGESNRNKSKWINEPLLALAPFLSLPELGSADLLHVISTVSKSQKTENLQKLLSLTNFLKTSQDTGLKSVGDCFTLRRLIHIAKRDALEPGHLKTLVEKAALSRFLGFTTKSAFDDALRSFGVKNDEIIGKEHSYLESIRRKSIKTGDEVLIPDNLFHKNQEQDEILEDMAKDFYLNSHLLLIGNQGVGKNKLADRFLKLISYPRHYMQLHRDTTVQTLTMQTVVENGKVKHEDSALVKAARNGQVLLIDEADKAPLHVIALLKTLLDSGRLDLGDGRSLRPVGQGSEHENVIEIHPDFKIIMLANRPGFPFLGNNLFSVLGDLFAVHMVSNPSRSSEMEMLKNYAPKLDEAKLNVLVNAFGELRDKSEQGLIQYPYSTRELVNVVRHCNEFPEDSLTEVVRNVFDFDSFNPETTQLIESVFRKHGIPLGVNPANRSSILAQTFDLPQPSKVSQWVIGDKKAALSMTRSFFEFNTLERAQINIQPDKTTKEHLRTQVFSEQVARWKLPVGASNAISDVRRIGDSILACTTNPPSLIVVEDVLNSEKTTVLDLKPHLKLWRNFTNPPPLRILCGDDKFVVVHDETNYIQLLINMDDSYVQQIPGSGTFSDTIGKLLYAEPWKTVPGEKMAYLYKRGQNTLRSVEITEDGVDLGEMTLPFDIDKVIASEESVIAIDQNGDMFLVDFSSETIRKINQENRLFPSSFTKLDDSMVFTSPEYYYLKCPNIDDAGECHVYGVEKKKEELLDVKAPYTVAMKEVVRAIDQARESIVTSDFIAKVVPKWETPKKAISDAVQLHQLDATLQVIDSKHNKMAYIPLLNMNRNDLSPIYRALLSRTGVHLTQWDDKNVLMTSLHGEMTLLELSRESLESSFQHWDKMTSAQTENLRLELEKEETSVDLSKLDTPKLGKIDPNNTPHHGGNTWMGGTGGYNTAGLGGIGGPFRLDAGHDVHQMPDFAKKQVPEHILKKAREIAEQEYQKKLKEIDMSEYDGEAYKNLWANVSSHSKKLTEIVNQLEAKKSERIWEKHQTTGDLDDGKLIEGIVGEKNIYRRRFDKTPDPGTPLSKPKRLRICFDVSGSMYRFNGYDKRLQKSLEAALLFMTALKGKQDIIKYEIYGHSGDSPLTKFVGESDTPNDKKQELNTLKRMLAHSQYCLSGDNTVECLQKSVRDLKQSEDYDETVMVLISDANLDRYGIEASTLRKEMLKESDVNCFVIFIGSLGDQSDRLIEQLPAGKAFKLNNTEDLPKVMETIFVSNLFNNV